MYNEKNLPILKFLRWRRPLVEHPEFIRANRQNVSVRPADMFTRQMYPLLWPEFFPRRNSTDLFMANDAVFGLSRIWPEFAEAASDNIEAVSGTFLKALENSYDTFVNVELFSELAGKRLNGTLILPGGTVLCYDFTMSSPFDEDGKLRYIIDGSIVRLKDGRHLICDMFPDVKPDGSRPGTVSWHDFETMTTHSPVPEKSEGTFAEMLERKGMEFEITEGFNDNVMGTFDLILVYHLFKRYAQIDTVESMKERRDHKNLPDIRTTQPVTFYDCTWYTTIVRTEGFNVRGHFRLQPCGEGKRDRKLIYIHEFQKHGYIRRAKLELDCQM